MWWWHSNYTRPKLEFGLSLIEINLSNGCCSVAPHRVSGCRRDLSSLHCIRTESLEYVFVALWNKSRKKRKKLGLFIFRKKAHVTPYFKYLTDGSTTWHKMKEVCRVSREMNMRNDSYMTMLNNLIWFSRLIILFRTALQFQRHQLVDFVMDSVTHFHQFLELQK